MNREVSEFPLLRVVSKQCDQCLFSKNKIVSDKRKADLLAKCKQEDTLFYCHKFSTRDEEVCCRGFFDRELNTYTQLAKRLNFYVEVEEEGESK